MGSFWFWVVLVLGIVIGPFLLMTIIGLMLPKAHTAERSAELPVPPEQLWEIITDYEQAPSWRRGMKSIEPLPDHDGHKAWKEQGRTGSMPFYVEKVDPPREYVTRIIDKGMPFGGSWTQTIEPTDNGAKITVREDGLVYNPLFRFLSRFLFGHHATMDAYLADLRKHVEG